MVVVVREGGGEARKCGENFSTLEAEMLLLGFRFFLQGVKGQRVHGYWVMIITNIFLSPHYVPGTVWSNLCVSSLLLKRPDEVGTVIFLFLQPTRRPRGGVTRSEAHRPWGAGICLNPGLWLLVPEPASFFVPALCAATGYLCPQSSSPWGQPQPRKTDCRGIYLYLSHLQGFQGEEGWTWDYDKG